MSSDSEMEVDQENNNTVNGSFVNSAQRKLSYRHLMNRIEDIQESEEVGLHVIKEVYDVLKKVKTLDQECDIRNRVEKVDETVIDSSILSSASKVVTNCINALQVSESNYDPIEFAKKLVESVKDPAEDELQGKDLLKLLKDARNIVRQVPRYGCLYGAFDPSVLPEPKQKPERKRRNFDPKAKLEKKKLENVAKVQSGELTIDEIIGCQQKVLQEEFVNNRYQPVNYYKYVVDTDSFSETVQNMFYFSFLVRNGFAAMNIDEKGQPTIKPVSKKHLTKFRDENGVNTQMITSITEDEWKTFQIGTGFLQQRRLQRSSACFN